MGTNPVIKVMEIFLIAGFLIHIIMGLVLQLQNWWARPVRYKVTTKSETSTFSRQMIWTAGLILIFLVIHLGDFYFKAKFSHAVPEFHASNGEVYHDLGLLVIEKFKITGFMIFYGVMFIFLGFHLWHGFQSSFQSLGLNHPTYTPVIKGIGKIYTIVITAGFMAILLIIYFSDKY
jgi:succinate dehydrogenase / fumarate reductase cytochrome b subunit